MYNGMYTVVQFKDHATYLQIMTMMQERGLPFQHGFQAIGFEVPSLEDLPVPIWQVCVKHLGDSSAWSIVQEREGTFGAPRLECHIKADEDFFARVEARVAKQRSCEC